MHALYDDPRLTAYALDELPTAERAELEALLADDPEAAEDARAIKAFGATLTATFAAQAFPALGELARRQIEDAVLRSSLAAAPAAKAGAGVGGLVAATLLIGGVMLAATMNFKNALNHSFHKGAKKIQSDITDRMDGAKTAAKTAVKYDTDPAGREARPVASSRPEQPFVVAAEQPRSTFSSDVDTASYARVRSLIRQGIRPERDDVRIEELLNYFPYAYAGPTGKTPFAVHTEVATCPWLPEHLLLKVGVQGRRIDLSQRPRSNLVFLLDVSGSMADPNKLPLLKESLRLMLTRLGENDRVAIVVYAGASGLVLPSTPASRSAEIRAALDALTPSGGTNGGAGISLAYRIAAENFIPGGINRVLLATDGDFNVGTASREELVDLIAEKAKSQIYLSVLGFGITSADHTLESISNRGNGTYAFIDTLAEAKKVLVQQLGGTLLTIAKDVKLQLEFDPQRVQRYRLIGYENRRLANRDFADDQKDAGDVGAGHAVTAFYELVPANPGAAGRLATVRVRYKPPRGGASQLVEHPVPLARTPYRQASPEFRFAAGVAGFGLLLERSQHRGRVSWDLVEELVGAGLSRDPEGYRRELLELVRQARRLGR